MHSFLAHIEQGDLAVCVEQGAQVARADARGSAHGYFPAGLSKLESATLPLTKRIEITASPETHLEEVPEIPSTVVVEDSLGLPRIACTSGSVMPSRIFE